MSRMAMSQAAASLVRALIARGRSERNRILLTDVQSVDWQSLTFTGERHQIAFRIIGRDSSQIAERMCAGLEDAEFSIPWLIVADIALLGSPTRGPDGTTELTIEALTVSEN
jgi:hypothetical protein